MTIGIPLHRATLEDSYDTIIIGSGISGLAVASILSRCGQSVLVLEKHYTAGGFTHTYKRKGYEWDVGVHYIGDVHRTHSTLRRIFDEISDAGIDWHPMPVNYDRIDFGDRSYNYLAGEDNFRRQMLADFPRESEAIDAYLTLIRKVNRAASGYYMVKSLPRWLAKLAYNSLSRDFLIYSRQTTREVLESLSRNQRFISVLTGQWGDYGLAPAESSFAMHAMVAKHYINGAAYPIGGSSAIAKAVVDVIAAQGGKVVTNAAVQGIMTHGGRVTGVQLANKKIACKRVVSAAGVANTYRLLNGQDQKRLDSCWNLAALSPSVAHLGAYIGLKHSDDDLGLESTNLWLYASDQYEKDLEAFLHDPEAPFPVVYVSFPSRKDPTWSKHYPGRSTIEIVAPAPYQWFQRWENTKWQKRGKDYEELKQHFLQRLLTRLYQELPQLEGKIDFVELSTPLSTQHFSSYQHGELYGLNHSPKRFDQQWLRTDTPIKGLFLTGQDIVSCGVGGALMAGVLTCIRILGPWKGRHLLKLLAPKKRSASQTLAS